MRRFGTALLVLAALIVVGVVLVTVFGGGDDGEPGVHLVESDERALSVSDAIQRSPTTTFAVRGYAYDDGAFVQLCNGITDESPPRCVGPSVLLKDLDLGRLPLTQDEIDGTRVLYTEEPVVLGGDIYGTELTVVDILSADPEAE